MVVDTSPIQSHDFQLTGGNTKMSKAGGALIELRPSDEGEFRWLVPQIRTNGRNVAKSGYFRSRSWFALLAAPCLNQVLSASNPTPKDRHVSPSLGGMRPITSANAYSHALEARSRWRDLSSSSLGLSDGDQRQRRRHRDRRLSQPQRFAREPRIPPAPRSATSV